MNQSRATPTIALVAASVALAAHTLLLMVPTVWTSFATGYLHPGNWLPIVVEVALLACLTLAIWAVPRYSRSATMRSLIVTVALTLTLGYASMHNCHGEASPFVTPFYWTLQLFIGESISPFGEPGSGSACPAAPPVAMQTARILAVLTVFAAVIRVAFEFFRRDWELRRISRGRPVVAILGASAETADYVEGVIDRHSESSGSWWRRRTDPLIVVAGPAAHTHRRCLTIDNLPDGAALASLVSHRGKAHLAELHLLGADEQSNLRCLHEVQAALEGRLLPERVDVVVRIDDPWAAQEWRRRALGHAGRWVLDAVGVYEATARLILWRARAAGLDRLVVVGATPLALSLASEFSAMKREAVRLLSLMADSPTPPRDIRRQAEVPELCLVGPGAAEVARQHALQHARYGLETHSLTVEETADIPQAVVRAAAGAASPGVVVCDDQALAQPLLAPGISLDHPDWPVLAHAAGAPGAEVIPFSPGLHRYSSTLNLSSNIPITTRERLAQFVHNTFRARYGRDEVLPDTELRFHSLDRWEVLPPFFRQSNLRQVHSLFINAPAAGLVWSSGGRESFEIAEWQFLLLAMAEHDSWRASYLAHGWRQGSERNDKERTRTDLLPWAELRQESRKKALAGVKSALTALRSDGYVLGPDPNARLAGGAEPTGGAEPAVEAESREHAAPPLGGLWRLLRQTGTLHASQLTEPWAWEVDGHAMTAAPGDWKVWEDSQPAWSVEADAFRRDYSPTKEPGLFQRRGLRLARPARPGERVLSRESELALTQGGDWGGKAIPPSPVPPGQWILLDAHGNAWSSSEDSVLSRHEILGFPPQPGLAR